LRKSSSLAVIALLIGLTALYFAEALFFKGIFAYRDLLRYFYPIRLFTAESVKSGVLPLWNPYIFCGIPNLAFQQAAVFYPLSILYYILPFDLAFNLFLLLHIALAGIFTFFLAKRWGLCDSASIIAAVTYMLSGYIVSVISLVSTLGAVIWLPIVLLFFDKGLSERNLKSIFISSLCLAAMFLSGEPSIFYTTAWVLLFYGIFFYLNNRRACPFKNAAGLYLMAVITAVLLSMVQLAPLMELLKYADRTVVKGGYESLTHWSLPLRDTFNFFIPFLARTDFTPESYWKEQNWVMLIYLGVFSPLLLSMAVFLKRDWRGTFLWFTGLLFLLVSYGSNTPFYMFLYKFIPPFQFVRYPVRFLCVTTFAAAVLCGMGYDCYVKGRKAEDPKLISFFRNLLPVFLLCAVLLLIINTWQGRLAEVIYGLCFSHKLAASPTALSCIGASVRNIARFASFTAAGGIILFAGLNMRLLRQGIISLIFITLMVADFCTAAIDYQVIIDPQILTIPSPNTEYLKSDKSLFRYFLTPKTRKSGGYLRGKTYIDAVLNAQDACTSNFSMINRFYDINGYDSIQLANHRKMTVLIDTAGSPSATRLIDMLNGKYIVSEDKLEAKGYRKVVRSSGNLYENTNVLARAFLADSFLVLKNESEIVERFRSKDFDPEKEVILEEDPGIRRSSFPPAPRLRRTGVVRRSQDDSRSHTNNEKRLTNNERVAILNYTPNEVVIHAKLDSPKFLVLADTYYPGWKAYADGARTKLYKADYLLRAVYLESGEHTVRLVFDPFSFKLGLVVSGITLIFTILYIAIIRR
jgi:uncharacterized membrane protein YiaA